MINTIMAASGGSIVALLVQQVINKKWSLLMLCNGAIAGMVRSCIADGTGLHRAVSYRASWQLVTHMHHICASRVG